MKLTIVDLGLVELPVCTASFIEAYLVTKYELALSKLSAGCLWVVNLASF